jgi:hypothetical protein
MPGQTIGTVNVQVGSQVNPRVRTISYGGSFTLKAASDLNMSGVADGDVIVYQSATNSFIMQPNFSTSIDGGEY